MKVYIRLILRGEKLMFDLKQLNMENGLEVISIKKDTQLFSIHVGIKIGSLYENKEEKGISHFIEHMLFKGTNKRNNEQLNNELESLGGEYNAYTDYNCTVYSITALSEEFEKSVELLSDMIMNSNFPKDELDKERKVILSEIRTSKDNIEDYSFTKIKDIAYKNSPLKYDVLGSTKSVQNILRENISNFYNTYYVPNNCCISIVSPFEHEFVKEIINKYFSRWKTREFKLNDIVKESNIPSKTTSYKRDLEQSTIVYLFTFHGLNKKEEVALSILNHKLGESTNSILFRKLREENGLAYDIYTDLDTSKYIKSMYIYTAVAEENVDEAIELIEDCIKKIKEKIIKFDNNAIMLMKKVLKTAVVFTLEDVTDLSNYILNQRIDEKDVYEFIENMKEIDKIQMEDIHNVALKVLNKPTIHILKAQ